MIAVAWRQYRIHILLVVALAGALIGWMAVVGHAVPIALRAGAHCTGHVNSNGGSTMFLYGGTVGSQCQAALGEERVLAIQAESIYFVLLAIPLLAGLVFGCSLVAGDLQRRTNRLAWTQSVSRTRWYSTKSGIVVVAAAVPTIAIAAVASWWISVVRVTQSDYSSVWYFVTGPLTTGSRIQPGLFDVTGYVIVAYALFALALGVMFGAVFRRVFWSVLATIAAFVTVRLLIVHLVRPYYFTPLSVPDASIQEYGLPGSDWYVTDRLRNLPGGHATGSSPDEWCKTTTAPIVLIG